MKYFLTLGIIIIAGLITMAITAPRYKCVKSHVEKRHQDAYTTHYYSQKMLWPVSHPARDYQVTVCDKKIEI